MGDAFRGLTIRIGADTRPLAQAINGITKSAGAAQAQMNRLSKAMKFDKSNAALMASKIDLLGDKATHSARAFQRISTAMDQAKASARELASKAGTSADRFEKLVGSTREAYAATEKLRAEYNAVDKQLNILRDDMARIVAKEEKINFTKAKRQVTELRKAMSGVGPEADEARAKIERLLGMVATKGPSEPFKEMKGDAQALIGVFDRLRTQHVGLQQQLETMNKVEGFRAMKVQAAAYEAELRQAVAETARLKSELYALGGKGLTDATQEVRALDSATEKAFASARQMMDAYKENPRSIDALRNKEIATAQAAATLKTRIKSIEAALKEIENEPAFDKLAASSEDAYVKAVKVEQKYTKIGTELKKEEERVKQLATEMKSLLVVEGNAARGGEKFQNLSADIRKAAASARELRAQLNALGGDHATAALTTRFHEFTSQLTGARTKLAALNAEMSRTRKMANAGRAMREFGFGMYASVTPALMMVGRYAIQAAEDFDSAVRDMRKTVNGEEEDFKRLEQSALDYSSTHVTSAETLMEIEAMGGQLGIQVENLESFAKTVSNLDIATNMEADEIAEDLGKMATVMGMSVDDYDHFADSLVRLGNNMPAMESDIMTITTRMMGMGKVVGLTSDQMLAWSTAATATGQKPYAAGSSLSRFMKYLNSAVSENGESLQKWSKIAGVSTEEFASTFKKDASSAMLSVVEGMGNMLKSGEDVSGALIDLGINGVQDSQLLLGLANQMANVAKSGNVLKDSLQMSADAWNGRATVINGKTEAAGDAAREAQRKSEGFSGELEMMRNNAKRMAVELSDGALPIVKDLGSMFQGVAEQVHDMPDRMKTFAVGATAALAGVGPLTVGLGTFLQSGEQVKKMLVGVQGGFVNLANKIDPIGPQMQKTGKVMGTLKTAGGKLFSFLGSTKGMLAMAGAGVAIGLVADAVGQYVENLEKNRLATQGFEDNANRIREAAKLTAADFRGAAEEAAGVTFDARSLRSAYDEVTQANAELSSQVGSQLDQAFSDSAKAQYYGDLINDLAGNCEGSAAKVELLKDAIEKFNELTDSDVSVINNYTGDINALNDEIERNIDLMQKKTMQNAFANIMQETADAMAETSVEIQKNEQTLEDSGKVFENYGTSFESLQDSFRKGLVPEDVFSDINGYHKDLQDAYNDYETAMKNLNGDGMGNEGLHKQLEGQQKQFDEVAKAYETQTEKLDEATKKTEKQAEAARKAKAYQEELGKSGDFAKIAEKAGFAKDEVDNFSKALYESGISAEEFNSMGVKQFQDWDAQAKKATGDVESQIALVGQAWSVASDMGIDPVHIEITDDGGIKIAQDKLSDLEKQTLKDYKVEFDKDGTIKDLQDYGGTTTATVQYESEGDEEVEQDAANVEAAVESADGATATATFDSEGAEAAEEAAAAVKQAAADGASELSITINSNAEEVIGQLDSIAGYSFDSKNLDVQVDTSSITGKLNSITSGSYGGITIPVTFDMSASSAWSVLSAAVSQGASGVVTVAYDTVTSAIGQTNALADAINGLPDKTVNISATDSATSVINSVKSSLATLPTYKQITIHTVHTSSGGDKNASGGVVGGIPRNASGAINGIVTHAMLTNIGWVGEAGAEAVMHMKNAGGAVVPLSNRRYVRPFARAVASEMGGAGPQQVVHKHYTVNGMSLRQGSDGAKALEALFDAIAVGKGD